MGAFDAVHFRPLSPLKVNFAAVWALRATSRTSFTGRVSGSPLRAIVSAVRIPCLGASRCEHTCCIYWICDFRRLGYGCDSALKIPFPSGSVGSTLTSGANRLQLVGAGICSFEPALAIPHPRRARRSRFARKNLKQRGRLRGRPGAAAECGNSQLELS